MLTIVVLTMRNDSQTRISSDAGTDKGPFGSRTAHDRNRTHLLPASYSTPNNEWIITEIVHRQRNDASEASTFATAKQPSFLTTNTVYKMGKEGYENAYQYLGWLEERTTMQGRKKPHSPRSLETPDMEHTDRSCVY
jgi:hypothetical protein